MDMNIYELIRGRRHYLPESRMKGYMYQLLKSMDHMHRNGIFHRDIKVMRQHASAARLGTTLCSWQKPSPLLPCALLPGCATSMRLTAICTLAAGEYPDH